ncbi:MAG TPA: beta-galactosidase GalB [Pyrinomonadaceae bacterium]|nr:beta-galactosidase GalB [Pyrinomonadaceae bacterium]
MTRQSIGAVGGGGVFIVFLVAVFGQTLYAQAGGGRERVSFNRGWLFRKDDPAGAEGRLAYERIKPWLNRTGGEFTARAAEPPPPEGNPGEDVSYTRPDLDERGWRRLDLPHDWGVEGPFRQEYPGETGKLPWWGVGWYRKHFDVAAADRGRRIYLDVDGAMSYAGVWLNGRFVGGWPYGYASFRLDLTPHVRYGAENVVAIRLDNPPESSRWYPGGGIYRNVWLVKTSPAHVAHWGTYVTTPEVTSSAATVGVRVTLENSSDAAGEVTLRTRLYELGAAGRRLPRPVAETGPAKLKLAAGARATSEARAVVRAPKLWSTRRPSLYAAVTTVEQAGKTVDTYETVFGIRTVKFDAERGLLLNGEPVEIKGVCNHHDLGALGAAVNTRALERQLEILKEMGVNAVRTSHNPPAPELLDLADRMGLLVVDEAFDAWRRSKKKNDYHLLFDDWHEKDLRALVRRDRNHPSVILWSTGNEIPEQGSAEGHKLSQRLTDIVREEDPTRPVTAGANHVNAGYNGFQKTVDVFGYNYKPGEYGKFREKNPAVPLYGSETSSTVSSRGEYFFPVEEDKDKGKADFQVSSYDLYAPRWATTPDAEFRGQDLHPHVAGEFVWTGFDYLGEPTPYNADLSNLLNFTNPSEQARAERELKELGRIRVPSRSSYFGIVDLAGFPKDRFYIYQARWRPELPMAHLLPHWTWPGREGQTTPVHVYTSGDEAELFLNGRSLGRKRKGPHEYRLRWDEVKYEPGELRAVAYKGGRRWAEDIVKTAGAAAKLTLKADRASVRADGEDLSFVTVSVTDAGGLVVPRAKNRVRLELSGPGEILATDNGDATSFEPFQSKERNAYNGLCLVVIRTRPNTPGRITLRARSEGLKESAIVIRSTPAR